MESVCLGDNLANQPQPPVLTTAVNLRPKSTGRARRWPIASAAGHRSPKEGGYRMRLSMVNRKMAPY